MSVTGRKRKLDDVDSDSEEAEDVPQAQVLSHAAKRRLRKKVKVALDVEQPVASETTRPKAENRSAHCVWVGNLSFKTTPASLKEFFTDEKEAIIRIHMPTKALHGTKPGQKTARVDNKGFAYVDFATPGAKDSAIARSEGILDGRRLLIKDGSDFAGRPEKDRVSKASSAPLTGMTKTARKILSQQKNEACPTLFIGNLSFETKEEEIAALFGRVHPKLKKEGESIEDRLLRVRMGTFEDSGKCKGFAFVDFKTIQFATDALVNPHNHSLNGRALVVEYASPDAVRRGKVVHEKSEAGLPKNRAARRPQKSERIAAKQASRVTQTEATQEEQPEENPSSLEIDERSRRKEKRPEKSLKEKGRRPKPGASLANAPRENVAIVQSTGKKIVF